MALLLLRNTTYAIAISMVLFLHGCKPNALDRVLGKNVLPTLTEQEITERIAKSMKKFDESNMRLSAGLQSLDWITPQGDLFISGTAVSIDEQQRALLLQYRQERRAHIEQTHRASFLQSAQFTKDMQFSWADILSGNAKEVEKRTDQVGEKIATAPIPWDCATQEPMLATQQKLATSLPAFAPYATLTQEKINACWQQQKARQ